MNLMPIDSGGTAPGLIGGDVPADGDFAALMTGLMSGDTQIVPVLDIPLGDQATAAPETSDGRAPTDDTTLPLEFVGTPPSGIVMTAQPGDSARAELTMVADEVPASVEQPAEPVVIVPVPGDPIADQAPETAVGGATAATGPATVHPISKQVSPKGAAAETAAEEPVSEHAAPAFLSPVPGGAVSGGATPGVSLPESAGHGANRTLGSAPSEATPTPIGAASVAASTTARSTPVDGSVTNPLIATPESSIEHDVGTEPHPSQPDIEVDVGSAPRSTDTARPAAAISQPAMVGIARRVEEAIAALATKPDPKIVTLQLDELDGLRLTVALRPDGLHLSSSGDSGLTTEIERALASRGFDMASDGGDGRQAANEQADDRWRPQSVPPGRQRRTNQSEIRL